MRGRVHARRTLKGLVADLRITSDSNSRLGYVFVFAGSALLIAGNAMTICYKYVYKWMNKSKY